MQFQLNKPTLYSPTLMYLQALINLLIDFPLFKITIFLAKISNFNQSQEYLFIIDTLILWAYLVEMQCYFVNLVTTT